MSCPLATLPVTRILIPLLRKGIRCVALPMFALFVKTGQRVRIDTNRLTYHLVSLKKID